MIDLQQLKQLVTIYDSGTISKAAEVLFISQPALSRSMQRLEEDLGVLLFDHLKNKVVLNENGVLAVEYARKLLGDFDHYIEDIRAFDKSKKTISVGLCAPALMWQLVPELSTAFLEKTVTTEVRDNSTLIKGLSDEIYQIIITNEKVTSPDVISKEFCKEFLSICVPNNHQLADKKVVTYLDLAGISILLYEQIGSWKKVCDRLPNTRFIIQNDRNTFNDLISESLLPIFATNITIKLFGTPPNRIVIPIDEESATQTFYITVLKKNSNLLGVLI